MSHIKKISTVALFITTLVGSISFSHAMDEEIGKQYPKLPFVGIKLNSDRTVFIEERNGSSHSLLSADAAKQAIESLFQAYCALLTDEEKSKNPLIKVRINQGNTISLKEKLEDSSFRVLDSERANQKLQTMLAMCNTVDTEEDTTEEDTELAEQVKLLDEARQVGIRKQEEETARLQAETLRQEEAAVEQARQQKVQAQADLKKQQEEIKKREEETARLKAETLKLQQEAAALQAEQARQQQAQAEAALKKQQEENVKLQAEKLTLENAAAQQKQQKIVIAGRTPKQIEKNIKREKKRGKKNIKNETKKVEKQTKKKLKELGL